MPEPLAGMRILVTGAAGTLGRGIVEEAVKQGATVAASGRQPKIGEAALPSGVSVIAADLAKPAECRRLVAEAAQAMGGLDVLVNNAAVLIQRKFAELTEDDIDLAWAVNTRAPILLMQSALPYLRQSSCAAIVNIVSTAGFNGGVAPVAAYAMTKAALIILTKSVAREFGPLGIRVNCVSPATMESQMQAALSDEDRRKVRGMNALQRPAEVAEVARVVLWAASPAASIVTGTTIDATAVVM